MNSKADKLETLFEKWRESFAEQKEKFVSDGIMEEAAWAKPLEKNILFLLKETNKFSGVLQNHIVEKWLAPWPFVGMWAYGLKKTEADYIPNYTTASKPEHYKPALISSAVMNLNKLSGGGTADWKKIAKAAEDSKDFIKEELEIIQPKIVICGATFGIAKTIISGLDCKPIDPDGKCFKLGETLWIDYCHPSAYFRHDMMYYTLIALYQNCLRLNK